MYPKGTKSSNLFLSARYLQPAVFTAGFSFNRGSFVLDTPSGYVSGTNATPPIPPYMATGFLDRPRTPRPEYEALCDLNAEDTLKIFGRPLDMFMSKEDKSLCSSG